MHPGLLQNPGAEPHQPTPLTVTERVHPDLATSATDGEIKVSVLKTLWLLVNGTGGVIAVVAFPQLDGLLVFLLLTAITICAGHSVGMHRLLIHRSFEVPRLVEYVLVWLGVLVGMAGPIGMIKTHDMRDWHQRQTICPPHPSHGAGFWRDAWWQLCGTFDLRAPPTLVIEPRVSDDAVHRFLERTWMLQQLPVAILLYAMGGWAWVLWGCCLRIFVSLAGHWMVGHHAHRQGTQNWRIEGLPVQGYNLPRLSLITFGENWHGNHHAFPHSAKLGIEPGQSDPGFLFVLCLKKLGLAWNIKLPGSEPQRHGLIRLD